MTNKLIKYLVPVIVALVLAYFLFGCAGFQTWWESWHDIDIEKNGHNHSTDSTVVN